ncbi:MAG: hypothetical protein AAB725_01680 [Patescibacteria group bacterium]
MFGRIDSQLLTIILNQPREKHQEQPWYLNHSFSKEVEVETFIVIGLQRVSKVLRSSGYCTREEVPATNIQTKDKKEKILFPGAIAESLFPQIIGQTVSLKKNVQAFRDEIWLITEKYTLTVLTGNMAGMECTGEISRDACLGIDDFIWDEVRKEEEKRKAV